MDIALDLSAQADVDALSVAQRLQGRWDPAARTWRIEEHVARKIITRRSDDDEDAQWLRRHLLPPLGCPRGPRAPVAIATLPQRCWKCRHRGEVICGGLADPALTLDMSGWVPWLEIAEALLVLAPTPGLATQGIGPLRWRRSSRHPEGRVRACCWHCDAVQSATSSAQILADYVADGGTYAELPVCLVLDIPITSLMGDAAGAEGWC